MERAELVCSTREGVEVQIEKLALIMTALRCVSFHDGAMSRIKRPGIPDTAAIYRATGSQWKLQQKFTNHSLIPHYAPTQTFAFISSQVWREVKNNSEKKGGLADWHIQTSSGVRDEAKAQRLLIS